MIDSVEHLTLKSPFDERFGVTVETRSYSKLIQQVLYGNLLADMLQYKTVLLDKGAR